MVLTRRQRIADVVERLPADVQPRAALLLDQLQSDDNAWRSLLQNSSRS